MVGPTYRLDAGFADLRAEGRQSLVRVWLGVPECLQLQRDARTKRDEQRDMNSTHALVGRQERDEMPALFDRTPRSDRLAASLQAHLDCRAQVLGVFAQARLGVEVNAALELRGRQLV